MRNERFEDKFAFAKHYEVYYEEGDSDWRQFGALNKADNIQSL